MQDYCKMNSVHWGLTPIPGLSLEARSKHKKRKNQIEYAAASLRIRSFFRMILAILKVRRAGWTASACEIALSECRQRFWRYCMSFGWYGMKKQDETRELAALKIQSHYRSADSHPSTGLLFLMTLIHLPHTSHIFFSPSPSLSQGSEVIRERKLRLREDDARIIINRSLVLANKKRLLKCSQH